MQVISGKVQKAKKVVVYGPEGVGKSSLAAQFPRRVFIDTEGSTTEMDVDRLPKPSSWQMLNQQVQWIKQQGTARFGSLVIDTFDWAEMLATESVCSANNKKGVEDFGYGKGYIYVAEEIGRFLNLLSDVVESGIHVILVAHSQIVKFEQPDEMGAYDRYQLKLGAKTGSRTAALVKEWADMVLFINYKTFSVSTDKEGKKNKAQGGTRTIYANHHPAWDAKNRHGLPDEFPLDYGQIAHIFAVNGPQAGALMMPPAPPVAPPAAAVPPIQQPPVSPSPQAGPPTILPGQQQDPDLFDKAPDPNILPALRELMIQHQVTEYEIQRAVSQKGYYPEATPITNYDPQFINGVLVTAWPQVFGIIKQARELPFV
jgi:hypothetical protein